MRRSLSDEEAPIVEWALFYATLGWPVIPLHTPYLKSDRALCSCSNAECENQGKHPRWDAQTLPSGLKNATTDEAMIQEWWEKWPDANVAIATGKASGVVVIDVDPRHGGDSGFANLEETHGRLSDTAYAETGGAGRHYFFRHPGQLVPNSAGKLAAGVDVRGDGGCVVVAPSLHASGRRYEWPFDGTPGETELAPTPDWLTEQATADRDGEVDSPAQDSLPVRQGSRNNHLTRVAGRLRHQGLSADAIAAALLHINNEECDPPLPVHEVRQIANSVGRYPAEKSERLADPPELDRRFLDSSEPISHLMQREIEPPKALVGAGLILAGFTTLLVGKPGLGKTWLALQLLHSVARGKPWLGIPTRKTRCGFISLELTTFFVQARVRAITQGETGGLDDVVTVARPDLAGPVDLSKPEQADGILAWCRDQRLELVIIDAFSRTFHGDENGSKEVAEVLANLERIAQAGIAVVVIHHERKGMAGAKRPDDDLDALRGSSRLQSDPVTVLRLKRCRNGLVLVRAKANHATEADPKEVWLQQAKGGGYETVERPPSPKEVGAGNRGMIRALREVAGKKGCNRLHLEEAAGLGKSAVLGHLKALEAVKGKDGRYQLPSVGDNAGAPQSGEAA